MNNQNKCEIPSTTIIPKRGKGSTDDPITELTRRLRGQICDALQGHIMLSTLKFIGWSGYSAAHKSMLEGNSLKVSAELLPDFHKLCMEVKEKLNFKDDIDFYITGSSEINAYAISAPDTDSPHIINVLSGLFNIMNDDEKRFIIGHEIGHLLSHDTEMKELIDFVYPKDNERSEMPGALKNKVNLLNQLAELKADQCGYYACGNINACITAMYKLASGLDLENMGVRIEQLIKDNRKRLDFFVEDERYTGDTHPVTAIRIEALNLLDCESETKTLRGMRELLSILVGLDDSEFIRNYAAFIASAGIKMALLDDNKIDCEEMDEILEKLSEFTVFPNEYLQKIYNSDYEAIFYQTLNYLINENPNVLGGLLDFIISIVFSNKISTTEQINFIIEFGRKAGMMDLEIARRIAGHLREFFEARIR